jgi:hypothetical protein
MKDIIIRAASVRREFLVLAICLLIALFVNVGAIIAYQTHWSELLTTWRATLGLALGLFVVAAMLRLGWAGLRWLFRAARRGRNRVPSPGG